MKTPRTQVAALLVGVVGAMTAAVTAPTRPATGRAVGLAALFRGAGRLPDANVALSCVFPAAFAPALGSRATAVFFRAMSGSP